MKILIAKVFGSVMRSRVIPLLNKQHSQQGYETFYAGCSSSPMGLLADKFPASKSLCLLEAADPFLRDPASWQPTQRVIFSPPLPRAVRRGVIMISDLA